MLAEFKILYQWLPRGQDKGKEGWTTKEHKEIFEDGTNICYFYCVMASWMDAYVENCRVLHFKYVQFRLLQRYFNKVTKKWQELDFSSILQHTKINT